MDFDQLFKDLKELDFSTWNTILQWRYHDNVYHPVLFDYVIQCEIQKAIVERGWHVTIETRSLNPIKWRALVTQYNGRTTGYEYVADSPVDSILFAYLEAIRNP